MLLAGDEIRDVEVRAAARLLIPAGRRMFVASAVPCTLGHGGGVEAGAAVSLRHRAAVADGVMVADGITLPGLMEPFPVEWERQEGGP